VAVAMLCTAPASSLLHDGRRRLWCAMPAAPLLACSHSSRPCHDGARSLRQSLRSPASPGSPGRQPVSRPARRTMTARGEGAFECRTRQLCEYEAMAAMYELDDSFVAHDADVVTTLQQMVDSIEVKHMPPRHATSAQASIVAATGARKQQRRRAGPAAPVGSPLAKAGHARGAQQRGRQAVSQLLDPQEKPCRSAVGALSSLHVPAALRTLACAHACVPTRACAFVRPHAPPHSCAHACAGRRALTYADTSPHACPLAHARCNALALRTTRLRPCPSPPPGLPRHKPDEASAARVEWEHGTRADHEYLNGVLAQFSSSLAGEESSMQLLEKSRSSQTSRPAVRAFHLCLHLCVCLCGCLCVCVWGGADVLHTQRH